MATSEAQEASCSTSRCTYHVFLSFRGEDTRKNFTDHLHTALVQAGIHTFKDDDDIERGQNIREELQKAIQECKIAIIVFSKDYASSSWCLDELVMIMKRRKLAGLVVLPVFYDVDPSQVRKQTGSYARAFARHEKRIEGEMDRVEGWRAALREVADLAGMALDDRHESQFIQEIVKKIWNKMNQTPLHLPSNLVGMDSRVKEINTWLQDESSGVCIATVFGIGGVGKTIAAKVVFIQNIDRFEGGSFLFNVRDASEERNGLILLQRQLLSDLNGNADIHNIDQGIIQIKQAICCKRVLIVLDDVDQVDQLDSIIGRREWLYPGSKIIITTRYQRLLRSYEDCKRFEIKGLNDNESVELLCWHAFGQGHPVEGYTECIRKAIDQCRGLPLALEVFGSSLSGRSINVWESQLEDLEEFPDSKIQRVLRISYDSLQNDRDKNLFLDIACFFIGKNKDYAVAILDGCNFRTIVGIQNLIDRFLLTINEDSKLMMHQLLRDMGREIVRQESTDDPGKRSRIWCHKDAFTVLKEKTGTEMVRGLTLDLQRLMKDKHGKTTLSVNYNKGPLDESTDEEVHSKRRRLSLFSWLPINPVSTSSFPLSNEVGMETKTFTRMHKLKLLQLDHVKFRGDYGNFPKNLVWLCWHGFPLKSIPARFCLQKLVALDMRHSSLRYVWDGTRYLAELKFLNLSHSHGLIRTPKFLGLPSLERIILEDCINLVDIDRSIGELQKLVVLDLKNCISLRKLPRETNMLKSLEELHMSGCSKLEELPEDMRRMESLKIFNLDGVSIRRLLITRRDTETLSWLSLRSWHSTLWPWLSPVTSPRSIRFSLAFLPHSLVKLSLEHCNLSDDDVLIDLRFLPSLEYINLSRNQFNNLPESISSIANLHTLYLNDCAKLRSLPELPMSLIDLRLRGCTSLGRIGRIPSITCLGNLEVGGCRKLVEIQGLFKLQSVRNINTRIIRSLGLSDLESLERVRVNLINLITLKERETYLQVLHECGIFSIFLPGKEIPICFSHLSMGSSISFDATPLIEHRIHGFNLCISYALHPDPQYSSFGPHYVKIRNRTKGTGWTYTPIFHAAPWVEKREMLWLSHWEFGNQIQDGDQLDVSVVMPQGFVVKECGTCLVYEPEDIGTQFFSEGTILATSGWYQFHNLTLPNIDGGYRIGTATFFAHSSYYADSQISTHDIVTNIQRYWSLVEHLE